MNTTQLTRPPVTRGANRPKATPSPRAITQSLIDCHAAEHLLIGTHSLDGSAEPVCVTCQLNLSASS